ncbi:PQQ-dependent sugar dehydrogenase [Pleomorphovibrio marinus]|uniref:PQQ-dependent sugar dehydrogenase n=1 Tax=Pleomorphovibrio marinus TaxID=2164132 RepID=UPI000E0A1B4E|nr:PQQ-dependent sugar dehydrogenase [Pleomorphovibrio marinus]
MAALKPQTLILILFIILFSCQAPLEEPPQAPIGLIDSEKLSFQLDTLYTQLENPWGMAWLPDGRMLVTERKGEILVFEDDQFSGNRLNGVPEIHHVNQAGLLDIQLHPEHDQNGWIYIAYAKAVEGGGATAIMRFKLQENEMVEKEDLIVTTPAHPAGRHYGSRIVFDNENYLYFSNGDRGDNPDNAQNLSNSHGKIHRIHDDGRIPADNPFLEESGAVASIWTYGNRNPQGLLYDAENDRIWEIDHGPRGGDEINLIERGNNYGWPVITYGIDYDGSVISEETEKEGMEQPIHYWDPSIAPCGSMLVTSDLYPNWKGNLLIGALAAQHINRVELDGTSYVGEERLLQDIGRVRHVAQGPDGYIYAITEGSGLLVRIIPEE